MRREKDWYADPYLITFITNCKRYVIVSTISKKIFRVGPLRPSRFLNLKCFRYLIIFGILT